MHHLEPQRKANEDGIIVKDGVPFHKNIAANLMTVCEKCHDEFHQVNVVKKPKRQSPTPRRKKTTV